MKAVKTTLPFVVIVSAVISVLLLAISITKEDWMVEKIEFKLKPMTKLLDQVPNGRAMFAKVFNEQVGNIMERFGGMNSISALSGMKNMNNIGGDDAGLGDLAGKNGMGDGSYYPTSYPTSYPSNFDTYPTSSQAQQQGPNITEEDIQKVMNSFIDGSLRIHAFYGFKKICTQIDMDGMKTPIRWINSPSLSFCVDIEVFTHPEKYDLPAKLKEVQLDELEALNNGYIATVIGLLFASIGLVVSVAKTPCINIKFKTPLLFVSIVLFLVSAICAGCALGMIRSEFTFEDTFNKVLSMYSHQQQLQESGYQSNSLASSNGYSMIMKVVQESVQWDEYLGSPAVTCGVGIALLLLSVVLSLVEYCIIRNDTSEVSYNNVALT